MIIIGLGNCGKKYERTRHNAGFLALDKIREVWDLPDFKLKKKFQAEISENKSSITLVKPQTFMNESGISVRKVLDFYKLSPDDIIVIHDDLDIALGEFKISANSRSAGHNGVQNIIDTLGTQKFKRIRIGIGNSPASGPEEKSACLLSSRDFVLQKFPPEELIKINQVFGKIIEEIEKTPS